MSMITRVGQNCDKETHIVFDSYREDSIKNVEQKRRGRNKEMTVLDVISPDQMSQYYWKTFGHLSVCKTAFQVYFAEWITANYWGTIITTSLGSVSKLSMYSSISSAQLYSQRIR